MQVEYDQLGRMKFHPEFHEKQGIKWAEEEVEYLCKYELIDDIETISLALGRTNTSVVNKLSRLRTDGMIEHYRNLNKHW